MDRAIVQAKSRSAQTSRAAHFIRDQALKQDLSAKLTEEWLTAAEEAWQASHMQMSEAEPQNVIYKQAEAFLEGRIGGGVQPETRIVYIAGPTGVGKTTTIAKIAESDCSVTNAR